MVNIMDFAPLPWRLSGDTGLIADANGNPVAYVSARLNHGDDSWRVIANKLAAAPEMKAALEAAEGHLKETLTDPKWHPIGDCPVLRQVQAALAKERGE